ncbi:MAG TPA: DUF4843 domain-containing protein [Arachidicoccus sp.]|nr:DUF4843 domain-containing protein [Arachidicoccus sp.]
MKHRSVVLLLIMAATVFGCQKSELTGFDSPAQVYFDFSDAQRDSLLFTFAYTPAKASDTVYLPVKLLGIRSEQSRSFVVKIDADSTTAVVGKHYKALEPSYEITANEGICYVPLILYNTDPLLEDASVRIKFYLEATSQLGVGLPPLSEGRLVFSSKLERPDWWGMWLGDYYSRVKHQFFLFVTGQTSMTTEGLDAPKNLYFVSLLNSFLNDPFKWIAKHPESGYTLTKNADGSYDFYNVSNPDKKVPYVLDSQAGRYFFMDENGLEVK